MCTQWSGLLLNIHIHNVNQTVPQINVSLLVCENVFSFASLNFYCHLLIGFSFFSSYMTRGLVLLHAFVCAQDHCACQKSTPLNSSMLSARVQQVPYWFEDAQRLSVVSILTAIPGLLHCTQCTAMPLQAVAEYAQLSFHPGTTENIK